MKLPYANELVLQEIEHATKMFGKFNTYHEGYAVIKEELDELSKFLYDNSPDHPEIANKDLLLWTKSYRFISRSKIDIVGYIAQIPQIFRYRDKNKQKGIERIGWSTTLVLKDFGDLPDAARRRTAYTHELLSKVENNPPWQFAAVGVVPDFE